MYATDDESILYFTGTINETRWLDIDPDTRVLLLLSASQYIDNTFQFTGTQTDEVVAFPRSECYNKCTLATYLDDEVPQVVKNATCEIALAMYYDDEISTSNINTTDYNIVSEKVGSLAVTYRDKQIEGLSAKPYGYTWLRCILRADNIGMVSARIVKG